MPPATDRWSSLRGTREGNPWIALVATGLGCARMISHPWRLDVELNLKDPDGTGLPGKEELQALGPVEDRMVELAGVDPVGLIWTHRTWNGVRTTSFYVKDPAGLDERLAEIAREAGYRARVLVDYDPRWKVYRQFLP